MFSTPGNAQQICKDSLNTNTKLSKQKEYALNGNKTCSIQNHGHNKAEKKTITKRILKRNGS